jgi:hypothetical protein
MPPETTIYCPFCDKQTVKAVYIPGYLKTDRGRGSGQSGSISYRTGSTYKIISGCSNCGKTAGEIQKEMFG